MSTHALILLGLALAAGADAGEHLLAGARHFREARYTEALVEFRVAERMGDAEARAYAGATLVKLGRPEEALDAFGSGAPAGGDALLGYYRALACYDARLYLCADALLAGVGERSGPRVAAEAARLRAEIARALRGEPATAAVDHYLARCEALGRQRRPAAAAAFCREAKGLSARRRDGYRGDDARRLLAGLPAHATAEARP